MRNWWLDSDFSLLSSLLKRKKDLRVFWITGWYFWQVNEIHDVKEPQCAGLGAQHICKLLEGEKLIQVGLFIPKVFFHPTKLSLKFL